MDRRERRLALACALAAGVAVLGVGGAPRWSQAVVALIVAGGLVATALSRRGFARRSPLTWLLFSAAAWTAFQLLPSRSLSSALTPTLSALRDDGAALVNVSVAPTLTMDAGSTLAGLAFLVILAGVAVIASRLAVTDRGRYVLHAIVAVTAGIAALVAGVHALFGTSSLYGFYEPSQARPTIMGPLLNPNHLGCLMAVGALTAAGLLLYPKQATRRRLVWAVIVLACIAVLAATLSRGAIIALGVGVVLMVLTVLVQRTQSTNERQSRRRREKLLATTIPIGIMIVCGLTLALYIGAGSVMHQLENTSFDELHAPTSKFAAWRSTLELVGETPWVGVGRGAFETTFTRVHPASAFVTFSHPENISLQAIVDWGIPAVVILLLGCGWLLWAGLRRWKDGPLAAGALGGIGAVGFQSNFDFGLELLGVALPFTLLLASIVYVPLKELPPARLRRMRIARFAHVALLVAGAGLLFTSLTETTEETHLSLREDHSRDALRAAIEKHPLDYYPFALLAEQMDRDRDPAAIRVLNHALRLHPTHAGLHRLTARMLLRGRRLAQAEAEYATAIRYSVDLRPVLAEVVRLLPADSVVRAIPVQREPDAVVTALQDLRRTDIAIAWLQEVLRQSRSLRVVETLLSIAMDQKDYAAAELALRSRCTLLPSSQCRFSLARVLVLAERHDRIIEVLHDVPTWHGRKDEKREAWLLLCDSHIALEHVDEARECLRRLDVSGLVTAGDAELVRRIELLKSKTPALP